MTTKRENEPKSKVTVRLPDSLIERAKVHAIKQRSTLQVITAEALDFYLKYVTAPGRPPLLSKRAVARKKEESSQ
jgi:hypothetical protein